MRRAFQERTPHVRGMPEGSTDRNFKDDVENVEQDVDKNDGAEVEAVAGPRTLELGGNLAQDAAPARRGEGMPGRSQRGTQVSGDGQSARGAFPTELVNGQRIGRGM